ncbi:MAG: MotA/TolQ/ExbB proton channel family protein [Oleispira sp.]|nr:MotA/TolQ/ExbB proton channel family protein [Oleispira sp.]
MNIYAIEELMYRVSDIFLAPVLISLLVLFAYSLFALGSFFAKTWQRKHNALQYRNAQQELNSVGGYDLFNFYVQAVKAKAKNLSYDDLEVFALKKLEIVRLVTRISPMLGLIATMIPMGPALKSLADGNIQGISDNLVIAFSSVIFGLVVATITFWVATVEKRWLAVEILDCQKLMAAAKEKSQQELANKELATKENAEVMHAVS